MILSSHIRINLGNKSPNHSWSVYHLKDWGEHQVAKPGTPQILLLYVPNLSISHSTLLRALFMAPCFLTSFLLRLPHALYPSCLQFLLSLLSAWGSPLHPSQFNLNSHIVEVLSDGHWHTPSALLPCHAALCIHMHHVCISVASASQ